MPKCPHCSASFSVNTLFAHGMLLGRPYLPLRCAKCSGRSYLGRNGSNTRWALAILIVAFIAWFWLSRSHALSGVPRELVAIALAGIWAVGVLGAFAVFTLGGRLTPMTPEDTTSHRVTAWRAVGDYVFLGSMVVWMYFVYRGVMSAS
jgi:hypothetical protein